MGLSGVFESRYGGGLRKIVHIISESLEQGDDLSLHSSVNRCAHAYVMCLRAGAWCVGGCHSLCVCVSVCVVRVCAGFVRCVPLWECALEASGGD